MKWRDPTQSIWNEALQLLERADRLRRQFFPIQHQACQRPAWAPPADIFETERELVIIAALPGIAVEELVVPANDAALLIRGERALRIPCDAAHIRRLEIRYDRCERRIGLPDGQHWLDQRLLKDGCLFPTLSKRG